MPVGIDVSAVRRREGAGWLVLLALGPIWFVVFWASVLPILRDLGTAGSTLAGVLFEGERVLWGVVWLLGAVTGPG